MQDCLVRVAGLKWGEKNISAYISAYTHLHKMLSDLLLTTTAFHSCINTIGQKENKIGICC